MSRQGQSSMMPWALLGGTFVGAILLSRHAQAKVSAGEAQMAAQANTTREGLPESRPVESRQSSLQRALPRDFDPIFRRYGHGLPVSYLRSLAKRESDFNPLSSDGPAWGILQVIEVVRKDYNERHQASYSRQDLLDATVCTEIASDLLRRIVVSYEKNHPQVANMAGDWSNPRFVELLTFGWNAGYSERGGVGKMARFLTDAGRADDVTIDTVFEAAMEAGASKHLSNPKKVAWCKSVARLYESERHWEQVTT